MQIRFQLSLFANRFFIINYVTLIMAQDAPKRRFLSLIFLVSDLLLSRFWQFIIHTSNDTISVMPPTLIKHNIGFVTKYLMNNLYSHSLNTIHVIQLGCNTSIPYNRSHETKQNHWRTISLFLLSPFFVA